jgi:hypothetical protein
MAKAGLPETQFLGPKSRGVRMLAEAHTGTVYRSFYHRHLYSQNVPRRGGRHVKGTNGSLNHSHVQNES